MASSRRTHYRKNRRNMRRDQKQTVTGVLSGCFGGAAVILFIGAVIQSFLHEGEGSFLIGTAGLLGLILAAGAVAFALITFRTRQAIRRIPPRTGMISGGILVIVFCGLYIYGIIF